MAHPGCPPMKKRVRKSVAAVTRLPVRGWWGGSATQPCLHRMRLVVGCVA